MRNRAWRHSGLSLLLAIGALVAAYWSALAQTQHFATPPRTIADITAILDQERPDPTWLAREQALADARPREGMSRDAAIKFYSDRATTRSELGRLRESIADIDKVIELGQDRQDREILTARAFRATQLLNATEYTAAQAELAARARLATQLNARGFLFAIHRQTVQVLIALGDLTQAETYVRRLQAQFSEARSFANFGQNRNGWEAEVERAKGHLTEAKGQYREAELAYRRSEQLIRETISKTQALAEASRTSLENRADLDASLQGRVKARQGRLAEAEADVRRALLSRLRARGKYAVTTTSHVDFLAFVLREQGRYAEAEKLIRVAIDIRTALGVTGDSQAAATGLSNLSFILRLQQRHQEAMVVDAELDQVVKAWEPRRRAVFELNSDRVYSLYASGQTEAGIKAAKILLAGTIARLGETNAAVAWARCFLGIGLARAGRDAEAGTEFKKCVPSLVSTVSDSDVDDSTISALRNARLRDVVENYIGLLARSPMTAELLSETLRLADAVRGQSVQQALAASSARMLARDPALADLARRHQDLEKQVNALLGILNNVLGLPPEQHPEAKVRSLTAEIDKLRSDRAATRKEIERRFPSYGQLVDPKTPSLEDVRAVLRPGEAFLSFYLGQRQSFVWAVGKQGEPMFASIAASASDIEAKVRHLRATFQPGDEAVDRLSPFDVAAAYELYSLLLQPVEEAWRSANELVVVTNGALGLLPLALLPTAPFNGAPGDGVLFSEYRQVSWLARTHAASMVPSAAAFATLRRLAPGLATRDKLIGFGDPYFTQAQAAEAESGVKVSSIQLAARSARVRIRARVATRDADSAGLDALPRLPDTADELRAVAAALGVDATKALHLGKDANERVVKQTDLSRFRIVAFATHGLVPGDLDGLTQPALALTAPSVAGIDGDGLLTMEEILPLKLDADWVVLSACNTASGIDAGAEAISGLGRAFFYAGTRALLVTNWAVDSASARDLVTDIFRRQAVDPHISRARAHQQAMLALMDGPGYVENGQTLYSYAHPLFWAPYSIVGDGG